MASRNDFYYNQLVTESELDGAFDSLEQADWDILADADLVGLVSGGGVTEHSPTPDLTVDVATLVAYDSNGKRIQVSPGQTVDLSVDYLGAGTAVSGAGNSKILSLQVYFDRALSDPRVDGDSITVYFVRAESYGWKVIQGAEATTGTEVAPSVDADKVLLADVTIDYAQTQILNADIDSTTRSPLVFQLSAGALSVQEGTAEEALQAVLTELNNHITDVANAHDASAVAFGSAPYAGVATTLSGTDLDTVIKEIVDELPGLGSNNSWTGTQGFGADLTMPDAASIFSTTDFTFESPATFNDTITLPDASSTITTSAFVFASAVTRSKAVSDTGVISPATLAASVDNWAPTGFADCSTIRVTAAVTSGTTLTGIAGGFAGRMIRLCNISPDSLTLAHDSTSTAANRFYCPGGSSFVITPNGSALIWYDTDSSRWRVTSE